jgi:pyruvate/2-oxoglutarate dehydrogenase complex dihydrolipoamide dehydrogenase (E3) component
MRMITPERYDAIVIGGQAGGPLASALARSGRRTALSEREHLGGICINEGCTPAKTMVASARVAYLARRAAGYGVSTGPIAVDLGRVRERKRANVKSFRARSLRRIGPADGPAFTPISYDDFRIIRTNLLQGGRACITDRLLPYVVLIDPNWVESGSMRRTHGGRAAPTWSPGCR